MYKLHL